MPSGNVNYRTMHKINIVGSSGSGKSTLARQLAQVLKLPYVEMDSLFWLPNWQESPNALFFAKLQQAFDDNQNGWVLDGNYSRSTAVKWQDVDTVIWLNYSFTRTLLQLTRRTILRSVDKTELWAGTGNHDSFKNAFFTKQSILLWLVNNYHPQQRKNRDYMQDINFSHIQFIEFTSPQQTQAFLNKLQSVRQSNPAVSDPPALA